MIQSDRRKTYPDVSVGSYAAKGGVNVMMLVIALKVTVVQCCAVSDFGAKLQLQ